MQGILLKKISHYNNYILYNLNLPYYLGNINIVPVIINNNYKVYNNEIISFNGDLVNDYNDTAGLITNIKIDKLHIKNSKYINFSKNYFYTKCLLYKVNKPLSKTLREIDIFKFSIKYENIYKDYTVLNCIAFGKTAILMSHFNINDYIYVKGKLISRQFIYKNKYQRQAVELYISECELLKKR